PECSEETRLERFHFPISLPRCQYDHVPVRGVTCQAYRGNLCSLGNREDHVSLHTGARVQLFARVAVASDRALWLVLAVEHAAPVVVSDVLVAVPGHRDVGGVGDLDVENHVLLAWLARVVVAEAV